MVNERFFQYSVAAQHCGQHTLCFNNKLYLVFVHEFDHRQYWLIYRR